MRSSGQASTADIFAHQLDLAVAAQPCRRMRGAGLQLQLLLRLHGIERRMGVALARDESIEAARAKATSARPVALQGNTSWPSPKAQAVISSPGFQDDRRSSGT